MHDADAIGDLEQRLAAVRAQLADLDEIDDPDSEEIDRYIGLDEARAHLERRLAAAQGNPYAEPIAWAPRWCTGGGAFPRVVTNSQYVVLAYEVETHDGLPLDENDDIGPTAVVTFTGWPNSVRVGAPNNEVLTAHALHSTLSLGSAHIVRNSPWLSELRRMNADHPCYDPEHWDTVQHFVLLFHDAMFECVATGYSVDLRPEPIERVLPMPPLPEPSPGARDAAWSRLEQLYRRTTSRE